jgi:hypothetical protein
MLEEQFAVSDTSHEPELWLSLMHMGLCPQTPAKGLRPLDSTLFLEFENFL